MSARTDRIVALTPIVRDASTQYPSADVHRLHDQHAAAVSSSALSGIGQIGGLCLRQIWLWHLKFITRRFCRESEWLCAHRIRGWAERAFPAEGGACSSCRLCITIG